MASRRRGSARRAAALACVSALVAAALPAGVSAIPPHPHRRLSRRPASLRAHLRAGRFVDAARAPPDLDAAPPSAPPAPLPAERWVTQPLDHFDRLETRTWKQRYFANDAHWTKRQQRSRDQDQAHSHDQDQASSDRASSSSSSASPAPLVFLCVGGEGPAFDPTVVTTGGPHCALAVEMAASRGALILALEHRFYGPSQPTGDLTVASLRHLSSAQALADAARFVAHAKREFGIPDGARWVAFGGSYPGMLASWLRLKYPHLVHAAVASSAPVQAAFAMPGYDRVVGESLAETDVGGSKACVRAARAAFRALGEALRTDEGRRRIEAQFHVCGASEGSGGWTAVDRPDDAPAVDRPDDAPAVDRPDASPAVDRLGPLDDAKNRLEFLAALSEAFPAQSNDPACDAPACDIARVCDIMTGQGTETETNVEGTPNDDSDAHLLARLATVVRAAFEGSCVDADHAAGVAALNATSVSASFPDYDRSWFWQTCAEFGFYQTCEDATCPFLARGFEIDADFFAETCRAVFEGMDPATIVRPSAALSNERYGGWAPETTRVLYPSGSVDPWRANSLTEDREFSPEWAPTMTVRGASHHAWTHPSAPTDQPSVVAARVAIARVVDRWVAQGPIDETNEDEERIETIETTRARGRAVHL